MLTGLLLDQIWPKLEQAIQIGSGSVLHSILWKNGTESDTGSQIQVRPDSGHNQNASESDPACLLGTQSCLLTVV